jgi:hypothetical protein
LEDLAAKATLEDVEEKLVSHTRQIATDIPVVGMDCLTTVLHPPSDALITATYFPLDPKPGVIASIAFDEPIWDVFGYSPWVVSPTLIASPQMFGGTIGWQFGYFNVQFHGPESDLNKAGRWYTHSHVRKQWRGVLDPAATPPEWWMPYVGPKVID